MPYFRARTFPAFDRNKPQTKAEQVVRFAQSRWRYVGGRFCGHLNVGVGRGAEVRCTSEVGNASLSKQAFALEFQQTLSVAGIDNGRRSIDTEFTGVHFLRTIGKHAKRTEN